MTTSLAWVAWMLASVVFMLTTRNPILLLVILLLMLGLGLKLSAPGERKRWLGQNLRFIGTILFLSAIINFIFTHTGKTILFSLPGDWFLIGGAFTLESLAYGALNGLIVSSLYLTFTLFNKALSIQQLTRLIPQAFYPLTIITTISLSFFPSIQEKTRQIKEAQMIRGNPMKKLSDWLPIMVPLMVTSLENAIRLSESMTARGFQVKTASKGPSKGLMILILATFLVFSGWTLSLFGYPHWISWALYLAAGFLVGFLFFTQSKKTQITHLHQDQWQPVDTLATAVFGVHFLVLLGLILFQQTDFLSYSPYPTLAFPTFPPVALILALVPGLPFLLVQHDNRN
jgi:energy-coupling factor transport system permease protein